MVARLRSGRDDAAVAEGGDGPDRLIRADNLDVLASLPDRSLDLVYIDPPFGTGTLRQGGRGGDAGQRYRDRADDPEVFVEWLGPRLAHMRRALAETGSLFVHLDYRAVHYVKVALDRLFGRAQFVNEIVWCYAVGGKSRRGFGRKHDTILWYARTADWAFYPDAVRVPRRAGSHMRVVAGADGQRIQEKTDKRSGKVYRYAVADGKIPEDWWTDIETLNHSDRQRTGWPTQKPERLIERLVGATTRAGDLVADFFSGSGTTAVVAQRGERRFLAVDAEPAAIVCAAQRLEAQARALAAAGRPARDLVVLQSWTPSSSSTGAEPDPDPEPAPASPSGGVAAEPEPAPAS